MPGFSVILVEPQLGENIGMCARAMANFGLDDLRLVNPRDGWPQDKAVSAAANAAYVIERVKLYSNLQSAISDCHRVYATSARERAQMKQVLSPKQALHEAFSASQHGQTIGILFGRERVGLHNDEISYADAIITFPVNPNCPSLNIAQAVLLMGYEWFQQSSIDTPALQISQKPATREAVLSFLTELETALDQAGFYPPDKRDTMQLNMRDMILRHNPDAQTIQTMRGALKALKRQQ